VSQSLPKPVLFIGWLFILVGVAGFVYHLPDLDSGNPFSNNAPWVLLVRLLAIAGGALLLAGFNWARWLLIAWMGYHMVLSAMHSVHEFVLHCVLLVVIAYFLMRPATAVYFRGPRH
jgi:hypothetical protein